MSVQHYIQEGTKAYCKTRYSNMELLCTVVMCDNYNVKVKLPCAINGHTHDVVNIKELRCLPPEEEIILRPIPPQKNPLNNPFRKMLENLRCIEDTEEVQESAPVQYEQKSMTPDVQTGISHDELEFLEGLSEQEKREYMKLFL